MLFKTKKFHKNTHALLLIQSAKENDVKSFADIIDSQRLDYNMDYLDLYEQDGIWYAEFVCHRKHKAKASRFISSELINFRNKQGY